MSARKCEIPKCKRKHSANGLCVMHLRRQQRGTSMEPDPRERLAEPKRVCVVLPGEVHAALQAEGKVAEVIREAMVLRHWRKVKP